MGRAAWAGVFTSALVSVLCWVSGCVGPPPTVQRPLAPADFRADAPRALPPPAADAARSAQADRQAAAPASPPASGPADGSERPGQGDTASGDAPQPPAAAPVPSARVGRGDARGPVLLDVKVGEVNAKAIFAAEFLRPLAARLRAEAFERVRQPDGTFERRLVPFERWRSAAASQIDEALQTFINNELVIAEGLAQFTPEERAGLRNFLGFAQRSLARSSGGSITRAVRDLDTGETLREYLDGVRNQQIIREFAESIRRGIVITRSDVERAYIQRYVQQAEDPVATIRWIRVPKDDARGAARVADRLAGGEPFEAVAGDKANTMRPDRGGLWELAFEGEYESASFFASPAINEALHGLTEGEWAGPVEDGGALNWLMLERVERGYVPWEQAQSELRQQLWNERFNAEFARRLRRLRERAGLRDTDAIRDELVAIASDWFYPRAP